ncbi:hypothetical protein BOTBODRAFT_48978 [Botryobasidium botryosum FD-172 SS1]|uniref:Uncharacterized protein n=1 Tax=Botryobasidium botryosum (strain FD-172 SS1) TaxID=930990 RepID=A0A067LXS1_BOTB1|nr:hypothetical protein BOTBODRAFT_48978 [Botryobasidium botryosum FD-172 SS1]
MAARLRALELKPGSYPGPELRRRSDFSDSMVPLRQAIMIALQVSENAVHMHHPTGGPADGAGPFRSAGTYALARHPQRSPRSSRPALGPGFNNDIVHELRTDDESKYGVDDEFNGGKALFFLLMAKVIRAFSLIAIFEAILFDVFSGTNEALRSTCVKLRGGRREPERRGYDGSRGLLSGDRKRQTSLRLPWRNATAYWLSAMVPTNSSPKPDVIVHEKSKSGVGDWVTYCAKVNVQAPTSQKRGLSGFVEFSGLRVLRAPCGFDVPAQVAMLHASSSVQENSGSYTWKSSSRQLLAPLEYIDRRQRNENEGGADVGTISSEMTSSPRPAYAQRISNSNIAPMPAVIVERSRQAWSELGTQ